MREIQETDEWLNGWIDGERQEMDACLNGWMETKIPWIKAKIQEVIEWLNGWMDAEIQEEWVTEYSREIISHESPGIGLQDDVKISVKTTCGIHEHRLTSLCCIENLIGKEASVNVLRSDTWRVGSNTGWPHFVVLKVPFVRKTVWMF